MLGYSATKAIQNAAKEGIDTGLQSLTLTPQGAAITTHLIPEKALTLIGVELCQPPAELRNNNRSFSCLNGLCQTVISIEGVTLPQDLTISRKHNETCTNQTIPNIHNYITTSYSAKIGFTPQDNAQLSLGENNNLSNTPHSLYSSSSSIEFNGMRTITLDYDSTSPQKDEFKLGDKLIHVQYTPLPSQPTPPTNKE